MSDSTPTTKVQTVLPPPPTIYESDPRAKLASPEEESLYEQVLAHFSKEGYAIPNLTGEDNKDGGVLREEEKFWLSRDCLLRFLRASKWKLSVAIARLEDTLKWRREFGIYDKVDAAHVEPEAVTGKEILFGYDVAGRPAFYMIPSRQNTTEAERQIQFAFWMLERCIDMMEPGVENIALLINFADKAKHPSMSTARAVLHILQTHYPEHLGKALIINIPFLVSAFFKIIMTFVDPVTREKVKFNPKVIQEKFFEPSQIMKEYWGGEQDFEYVHETYWKSLNGLCDERRARWKENWRKLGAKVGISEWDYKTGAEPKTEKEGDAPEETEVKDGGEAEGDAKEKKDAPVEPAAAPKPADVAPVAPAVADGNAADNQPEATTPAPAEKKKETEGHNAAPTSQAENATTTGTIATSGAGATAGGAGGGGGAGDAAAEGGDAGGADGGGE